MRRDAVRPSGKMCCAIIRRLLPTAAPDEGRNDFGGRAGSCPFPGSLPRIPMTPEVWRGERRNDGVSGVFWATTLFLDVLLLSPSSSHTRAGGPLQALLCPHARRPEPALESGIPIHVGAARRRAGSLARLGSRTAGQLSAKQSIQVVASCPAAEKPGSSLMGHRQGLRVGWSLPDSCPPTLVPDLFLSSAWDPASVQCSEHARQLVPTRVWLLFARMGPARWSSNGFEIRIRPLFSNTPRSSAPSRTGHRVGSSFPGGPAQHT